jgi:hypothetical protein
LLSAGDLEPRKPAPLAAAPSSTEEPVRASHGDSARTLGVTLGAIGLAGLAVGAVTGVMVLAKRSIIQDPRHRDQVTHACDQAALDAASEGKTLGAVSTVAFAAGGAALAAGVIVFIAGGSGSSSGGTFVTRTSYAGGGVGLRLVRTF